MTTSNYCPARQKSKSGEKRLNLKYFNLFLFVFIAIFGGFYLFNVNELTVQGFVLAELKSQANVLTGAKAEIEEQINSTQSYYSLSSRLNNLNMVQIASVEYLKDSGQMVAKK
jgi:hypothetical protein